MSGYVFREAVKAACLDYCLDAGLDINDIVSFVSRRTGELRNRVCVRDGIKSAGIVDTGASLLKTVGAGAALMLPISFAGSALVGNVVGKHLGDVAKGGDLPTEDEVSDYDLALAYEREAEEIQRRIALNKRKRDESSRPSSRRLF
jgi:hypothetical protein